jgi:hypothetical protein
LTDLINSMLDTVGLSKVWWGDFIDFMSCLNRVSVKNKEKTTYEEWIERKLSLSYLCT